MRRVNLKFQKFVHKVFSQSNRKLTLPNANFFQIELHDLIRAGVIGFKCYLIDSGVDEFPYIQADELSNVFAVLNGTGTVLAVST